MPNCCSSSVLHAVLSLHLFYHAVREKITCVSFIGRLNAHLTILVCIQENYKYSTIIIKLKTWKHPKAILKSLTRLTSMSVWENLNHWNTETHNTIEMRPGSWDTMFWMNEFVPIVKENADHCSQPLEMIKNTITDPKDLLYFKSPL